MGKNSTSKSFVMSLVENEIISFLKTEKSYHLNILEAQANLPHCAICLHFIYIHVVRLAPGIKRKL